MNEMLVFQWHLHTKTSKYILSLGQQNFSGLLQSRCISHNAAYMLCTKENPEDVNTAAICVCGTDLAQQKNALVTAQLGLDKQA